MAKKAETTEPQNDKTEAIGNVQDVVINPPRITPEMAEMLLEGNFEYIRKYYGIGNFHKAKTKENKQALLLKLKKLVDSMNYMGELL